MAQVKHAVTFAIKKKYLHENILPKYPEIATILKEECARIYKKQIFQPVNEMRKSELVKLNKTSVYRKISFDVTQAKDNDKL